ncbi:MAG: DUF4214 domain-containing protein [Myxococcota bacterium]
MLLLVVSCTAPSDEAAPSDLAIAPAAAGAVVDAESLRGKLIFGYQGWFGCPDDGSGRGWVHWNRSDAPRGDTVTFDAWPDLSEYDDASLCASELHYADGSVAPLYSAWAPETTLLHFDWMRTYGIDGVLLQRFNVELYDPTSLAWRDQIATNVKAAAEASGRVYAIEYDISGGHEDTIADDVIADWKHMVDDLGITESDRYLHHDGRPLVAVWGFGFSDRPGSAGDAMRVIDFFHNAPEERYRATLVGGVPGDWRTLRGASKTDSTWSTVYRSWDIVSPWSVGAYVDDAGIDAFRDDYLEPDLAECAAEGIEYMPTVWPGFSWANLFPGQPLNQIPRRGGDHYWRQVYNAVSAGSPMVFNAMFDEVDEGTAMFKIGATRGDAPTDGTFLTLDADGESLPNDWYLRLGGAATRMVNGSLAPTRTIPISPGDPPPAPPEEEPPPDEGTPPEEEPPPDEEDPPAEEPTATWNETLVASAYRGILGREPDEGGYATYVDALDGGLSTLELAHALWDSEEFAQYRAPLGSAALAADLYRGILDREADPEGLAATIDAIDRGAGAERAADMLESDEARALFAGG